MVNQAVVVLFLSLMAMVCRRLMFPSCCTAAAHPALHLKHPSENGTEKTVAGIPVYETGEGQKGPALVVFPDIFGWRSGRTRQICDELAQTGIQVILPNFFHEDGSIDTEPLSGCSAAWYIAKRILYYNWSHKHSCFWASLLYPLFWTKTSHIEPVMRKKILPYLTSSSPSPRSIGVMGFCWGGWMAFHSASLPEIKCAIAMHPSVKMESFHGGSRNDLFTMIDCPTMCLAAGDDPEEVKPFGALSRALGEKSLPSSIEEYSDMKHGWVPRGDVADSQVSSGVTTAVQQAVRFLQVHLHGIKS